MSSANESGGIDESRPAAALRRTGHGSETRARGLTLKFRVDAAERESIRAAASRAGLEVGSYLRARAIDGEAPSRAVRRPPIERAALAQILGLLGPVAEDVRIIRRAMAVEGKKPSAARLQEACDTIEAMRVMLMHALGRTP
jgi:hypothetical protein